jgi:TRAP-type mannitol/chloroaromatic compound transport system permease small subunit
MKNTILSLTKYIDSTSDFIGRNSSWLFLMVILSVCYEVVMRKIFNRPTIWVSELSSFACAVCYLLGAPFTLKLDRNLKLDLVYKHFSKRAKLIWDSISFLFFLFYMSVLTWAGTKYASESFALKETTGSPWNPPLYPLKVLFLVSIILLIIQGLSGFLKTVNSLINKEYK